MTGERLIAHIERWMRSRTEAPEALFLGGSFGRGTADGFSDLDFLAVVPYARRADLAVSWRQALSGFSEPVYWAEPFGKGTLINAVTQDWTRVDLYMIERSDFLDPPYPARSRHSQETLRTVLGPDNLLSHLPASPPLAVPDTKRIDHLITEFIRVLGLITVGLGRNELVLGVMGAGLLRDLLTQLMVEETASPERGGMLHLSRTITPEQMAELEALPYPAPERTQILAAHRATAQLFFPRARALAGRLDIQWPGAFEDATRAHLKRAFGEDMARW